MNKKKLLALSLVVVLIAILSFSSLAWFSDADEVTNTFKVANSEDDPDEIFSVDVWEPVDAEGNPVDPDENDDGKIDEKYDTNGDGKIDDAFKDQDGLEYEDILPGATYAKAPHVENTGSYDQYVRVRVTVGDATAWENALAKHNITDLSEIFLGHNEADWIRLDAPEKENGEWTYTYYLQKPLIPGETACLFTHVQIPGALTQEDMAKFNGDFKLTVVAEAMQVDGLPENVTNALGAFQLLEASGQEIDVIQ